MNVSWSDLYERRRDIQRRFGRVFSLPVVNRVRVVLNPVLGDARSVLDVGAGAHRVGALLEGIGSGAAYTTVDPDPRGSHDHASLDEVTGAFDVVVALEVAEHVPPDALPGWFRAVTERVGPGGRLVLSTPNTYKPQEFLRDSTHRSPLAYDQLGAWIEMNGLTVRSITRVHPDPWLRRVLRRVVFGWLFRLLDLDFARQVVVVAERPAGA